MTRMLESNAGNLFRGSERILMALCWASCLALFSLPISNPDIFWHLAAARHIIATGAIPRADWMSWTMTGQPWIDFEWCGELLLYGLDRAFGAWGLVGLKVVLFSGGAMCLWKTLELYEVERASRSLALLAWCAGNLTLSDLRMDTFSLLFFQVEWLTLEIRRTKQTTFKTIWEQIGFVAFFVLWANIHAGFVYGLVLLGIFGICERIRNGSRQLIGLALGGAAATMVNPYGIGLYRVLWQHTHALGELQRSIDEWGVPSITEPGLAIFWLVLATTLVSLLYSSRQRLKVPLEHVIAVSFFAVWASRHIRLILYFLPIAIPATTLLLTRLLHTPNSNFRRYTAAATCALLLFFWTRAFSAIIPHGLYRPLSAPKAVGDYLEQQRKELEPKKLFNSYGWGGYLEYRFAPSYKPFMDGRYIFLPLLREANEATDSPDQYHDFLSRYGVQMALVRRNGKFFSESMAAPDRKTVSLIRPYYLAAFPSSVWALVYWDNQALLFVRRDTCSKAWLDQNEFTVFRPDDVPAMELMIRNGKASRARLLSEIDRFSAVSGSLSAASLRDLRSRAEKL